MPDLVADVIDIAVAPRARLSPEQYYILATMAHYRACKVHEMRLAMPARVITPAWTVRELLYFVTEKNPDLSDAVLVVTLRGGLGGLIDLTVSTPLPGRRIVKLLYVWDDFEPHLHLKPIEIRDDVIAKWAEPGGALRAMVREARAREHG